MGSPLKHTTSLSANFEAAHSYGTGRCSGNHGHSWTLSITFSAEPEDEDARLTADAMLHALIKEVDGRNLNDQLPASQPSAQGVAAWAFERCHMVVPGLELVAVDMDSRESAYCAD